MGVLIDNPLLLLFLVVGVGAALGQVRVKGIALGPAAALFVGLAVSAADDRLANTPPIVPQIGLALAAVRRSGRLAAGSLVAASLLSAAWISWVHWPALAIHWTQREVFAAYRGENPAPDEPVVAWLMNWRGETFYGRNRVAEVADPARMREIAARPGRIWVVTEAERLPSLTGVVGPSRRLRVAGPTSGRYRLVELLEPPPVDGGAPR